MDFTYWNRLLHPERFLEDDWNNPARAWAGQKVVELSAEGAFRMAEVGPGNGIDYERQFRELVRQGKLMYDGYEGSSTLCQSLQARHPESAWINRPLLDLPSDRFDLVYAKAVLEHQPALDPSLSHLLGAAKKAAILIWYRPPAAAELHEIGAAGEHYWTFRRDDVLAVVARAGWQIVEEASLPGEGNLGWVLRRRFDATP